jgi:hypothetical protein
MEVLHNVLFVLKFVNIVGCVIDGRGSQGSPSWVLEVEVPEAAGVMSVFEHDCVIFLMVMLCFMK